MKKLIAFFAAVMLVWAWAADGFDYSLSRFVDTTTTYTSTDTLRKTRATKVVACLNAGIISLEYICLSPTDSIYLSFEGSNDETYWFALCDSVLLDGPGNKGFVFTQAEAFLYYRGRIYTTVDGADTAKVVARFIAGRKVNE